MPPEAPEASGDHLGTKRLLGECMGHGPETQTGFIPNPYVPEFAGMIWDANFQ